MLLMAEMIFHLTFEHGLKNGAKNLLQDVLYVFRALDVVVVEDLLSNLLAWGSWWSFTLCHSVTVLIFVYPSMGHKVDSCNTDLHKLFYTPGKIGDDIRFDDVFLYAFQITLFPVAFIFKGVVYSCQYFTLYIVGLSQIKGKNTGNYGMLSRRDGFFQRIIVDIVFFHIFANQRLKFTQ